jgi:hypothetical protein
MIRGNPLVERVFFFPCAALPAAAMKSSAGSISIAVPDPTRAATAMRPSGESLAYSVADGDAGWLIWQGRADAQGWVRGTASSAAALAASPVRAGASLTKNATNSALAATAC